MPQEHRDFSFPGIFSHSEWGASHSWQELLRKAVKHLPTPCPGLVAYSWLRCGCIAQLHHHAKHRHCRPLWLYVLYPSPGREHIRPGFPLPVLLQRGQRAAALSPSRACVCNWNCVSSGVTQRLELHPEGCPEAGDIHDSLKNAQIL